MQTMTLCLGHDIESDTPNGCPHADQCERHVALRARNFPNEATITGAMCTTMHYALFSQVKQGVAE